MSVLLGDTNADRFVDSVDTSQTKSQSGNAVGASNCREDEFMPKYGNCMWDALLYI